MSFLPEPLLIVALHDQQIDRQTDGRTQAASQTRRQEGMDGWWWEMDDGGKKQKRAQNTKILIDILLN